MQEKKLTSDAQQQAKPSDLTSLLSLVVFLLAFFYGFYKPQKVT
jgi:preprotein translocase subunit YajC